MALGLIGWQCPNDNCRQIIRATDISFPCFITLIAEETSTYDLMFPCIFCRKDMTVRLDNTYPTLAPLLLSIQRENNEFNSDTIFDMQESQAYWDQYNLSKENERLVNENKKIFIDLQELHCKKEEIDCDNEKIANAVEDLIASLGEERINKLDSLSLTFIRESMFKTILFQIFMKDSFKNKFLTEWGSIATEMTKVFERELKIRLGEYFIYMNKNSEDNWYKNPGLGNILYPLTRYKKLKEREKEIIDRCTNIHNNKELLNEILNINYIRNNAAHPEHFSFSLLEDLYNKIINEPTVLLAQFIDHIDPVQN